MRRRFRMRAKRLVKVRRVPMVGGGGVDVAGGGGDVALPVSRGVSLPRLRRLRPKGLVWRLWFLVKRFVRRSGGRSRAMVAASAVSAVDVSVVTAGEEIVGVGIVVGAIVAGAKVRVDVRLVAGIRGWIRCGNGLRLVVLGRARRMMRLWI